MRVLFGVFDWGIGHATRDIPLIEELLRRGHEVDVVSRGRALEVIKERFGEKCIYFSRPSVTAPYSNSIFFVPKFAFSIPRMIREAKKASRSAEDIKKSGKYDIFVSDCSPSVCDKKENSFLINHQMRFKVPIGAKNQERVTNALMRFYKVVIVPDFPGRELTGELGMNNSFKGRVEYIGILSCLRKKKTKEDIDYFISISGPEPTRTFFEKKILSNLDKLDGKIVVTRGVPDSDSGKKIKGVESYDYLNQKGQEEMMNRAKFVISRSGYTTVMDLVELEKKKVLFVPTPMQVEQEYLADYYTKNHLFNHVHQKKINLQKNIKEPEKFKGITPPWKTKDSVKKFMKIISG